MAKKIELLHTTYDESGNVESQEVVHPLTSPDCIIMENGKTLDEVMGDGIATPTLTHEGTSFKVGVGDSNIEVVDGDVAGMTLKGQSYQNILPKPTTLIMETDEQEFKINDKIDSNIIIDDNIAEIATVKGKTIVNAVQEESGSEYTVLGEDLSGQSIVHVKGTPALEGSTLVNMFGNSRKTLTPTDLYWNVGSSILNVKPNTKYFVKIQSNYRLDFKYQTPNQIIKQIRDTNCQTFTFTSSSDTNIVLITIDTNVKYVVDVVMLEYQEGMENWDIPYFEGEKYFENNIKGVTLQGQTLVNAIQEPCEDDYVVLGDGIEINAETGGYGTIEDTIGGSIKSAILKGNTLVNLQEKGTWTISNNLAYYAPCHKASVLKTDTKYIVYFTNLPSTAITCYFDSSVDNRSDILDNRYYIFTTKTNITRDYFIHIYTISGSSFTAEELANCHVMIIEYQEGMENWDIPYFEGMKSVQMPVVKTTGKNLYNINEDTTHAWQGTTEFIDGKIKLTSTENSGVTYHETHPIYVEKGKTYSVSMKREGAYDSYYIWKNGEQDKAISAITSPFTVDESYDFITIGVYTTIGEGNVAYFQIQLEEGSTITSYEPYQSSTVTTSEEVELRGIGDVKDELDLQTGKLTQRIGEIVLDGRESWRINDEGSPNTISFICQSYAGKQDATAYYLMISDRFKTGIKTEDSEIIDNVTSNFCYIRILRKNLETEDVVGFKSWLQSNPVTVQYKLATESIKTVDLTVTDQDGNTIPHIQTQPTVTHITASSDYLIPTVIIDNNLAYDTIIKPSTLYTVKFKHDTVNTDNPLTVDLGGTVQEVTSTEFTITTPDTLTHNQLVFSGKNNVVSQLQLIEGDVTSVDYPYFEGMLDVKSPKLLATGKNLFDLKWFEDRGYSPSDNHVDVKGFYDSNFITRKIKLDSKKQYTFSMKVENSSGHSMGFLIKYKDGTSSQILKPDVSVLRNDTSKEILSVGFTFTDAVNMTLSNIQIEEGSTATSYEPYKGVEVQQDVDSIPLTSDMFEQGKRERSLGMSFQQCSLTSNSARISGKTLIPVKSGSKYTVSGINTSVNHIWGDMYDKDGLVCYDSVLDLTGGISSGTGVFVPHDVHYLLLQVKNADESAIAPSDLDSMNLILQEVPQEIVLRGIGDVKDELDLTRGEYIQRIGEVVLDGYDSRITLHKAYDTSISLRVSLNGKNIKPIQETLLNSIKCDKLPVRSFIQLYQYGAICVAGNMDSLKNLYVCIPIVGLDTSTITNICEYFVSKPTKIQYILETPIIHKVNLTNAKVIPSYATETHYETITPSDSLIPNITIPSTLNYDVAIKPSTEYTIRANTSDNLTVDLGGTTGTLSNGKVTLTTPATLTHSEVKFSGTGKVKELMVVEGNEIKDNVPFFNGMKDVQMGGIKLVNIARGATCNDLVTANTNKTQFTFNGNGSNWGIVTFDKSLLKANTTYTVYLNVVSIPSDSNGGKFQFGDGDNKWFQIDAKIGIVKGLYTTTESELSWNGGFDLRIRPFTSGGQVVIQNPMIIEGDWTHLDEIPYIESEMIIEQPIIRSQGKNLFDVNKVAEHSTIVRDGNTLIMRRENPNDRDWVKVDMSLPKGTYTFSCSGVDGTIFRFSAFTYDNVELYSWQQFNKTYTFNTDIAYLKISTETIGVTYNVTNIQIEESSTATPYEPYKHQTLYSNRVIGYEEGVYYQHENGSKIINTSYNSIIADVEGLSIAYITHGHSNFSFWDKDGVYISGKAFMDTNRYGDSNNNGFIVVPSNAKYIKFPSGNSTDVSCKYTDTTVTGDLPLRSLPNGVCDTLNLVTGEYVQRVGEIVLDGSEGWFVTDQNYCFTIINDKKVALDNILFHHREIKYQQYTWDAKYKDVYGMCGHTENNYVYINLPFTKKSSDIKQYLSQNPITVQYELATPIVRKLGFTTKGNYREQVLDGSETWAMDAIDNTKTVRMTKKTVSPLQNPLYDTVLFTDDYHVRAKGENHSTYEYITCIGNGIYINIYQSKVNELSVQGCTQWLSQNPIKVGYITSAQSSESYSNIHKPIFFNNVNVQYLPNNVDIQPELTYQVRTRNSYVMDMMKANTKYSIKLLDYSGNMTIDGTSYTLANNRTFVSPSTLTNKELIISGQWYEPMVIEGDVTGKNLPYFKGILSSYHDVDEIELYSVTNNIFDGKMELGIITDAGIQDNANAIRTVNFIPIKPSTLYFIGCDKSSYKLATYYYDKNYKFIGTSGTNANNAITTPSGCEYMKFRTSADLVQNDLTTKFWINEAKLESYIPHTHNTTLIEMPTRLETVKVVRPMLEKGGIDNNGQNSSTYLDGVRTRDLIPVKPNMLVSISNNGTNQVANWWLYDIDKNCIKKIQHDNSFNSSTLTIPENTYFVRIHRTQSNIDNLIFTLKEYKPIQLNSLPNGVYDEIIMKPNSNKAQLVQRVGKVVLDGSENWYIGKDLTLPFYIYTRIGRKSDGNAIIFCDRLVSQTKGQIMQSKNKNKNVPECVSPQPYEWGDIITYIPQKRANTLETAKSVLKENPLVIYYELATPIIHEIQLKGYPHVYENGTVTLNTDTPHKTLISYNVNQEQLISNQNETIIRHDQQIDDLYYYIEMYLEEIYQMELFRMKLELSL